MNQMFGLAQSKSLEFNLRGNLQS